MSINMEEQDGGGVGGRGIHLSLWIYQEYTFRHRSTCRTPAEWTGVPDQWKRLSRALQNSVRWRTRGKYRNVSRTGPAPSGWGNWSRRLIPTVGQLSESEEEHLRLRVKQLICGSLNGMRIRLSLLQPNIPQIGTLVSWKVQQMGAGV